MMETIYLDYNATTPIDETVIELIEKTCRESWGNPSSSYAKGCKAKQVVDQARDQVGQMIGAECSDKEITFTSGGTEATYLALHSALTAFRSWSNEATGAATRPHFVTTSIEHCATELPLRQWLAQGLIEVTFVDVTAGRVDPEKLLSAILPNTCMVTIIMANNETGVIQPMAEVADAIVKLNMKRKPESLFPVLVHTDAAQTIGKMQVSVKNLKVNYVTIVGHKFYGPRIGALYHRLDSPVCPLFFGGGQECGLRAGTENTPMIAGLGQASFIVMECLEIDSPDFKEKRDYFEKQLLEILGSKRVRINFQDRDRLPNTASVCFPEAVSGQDVLRLCSGRLEASTSAACHSSSAFSSILVRSGLDHEDAKRSIRFSVGRSTSKDQLNKTIAWINEALSGANE